MGKSVAMNMVANGWLSVCRAYMRAGLRIWPWIRCVPGEVREGFEDYSGPPGKSGGGGVDWGCWWEDVGARNEDSLES